MLCAIWVIHLEAQTKRLLRMTAARFNHAPPNNSFNPTRLSLAFINLVAPTAACVVSSAGWLIRALDCSCYGVNMNIPKHQNFKNIVHPVIAGLLLLLLGASISAKPQDELKAKVDDAIKLIFNKEIPKGMTQLKELGSPAVPYVLDYMSRDGYQRPVIKLLLLDNFVSLTRGAEADAALIKLLSDKQPELRGYAANELGKRKVKPAIPHLVERLNDKASTIVIRQMNDDPNFDVLVRDLAIGALEAITDMKLAEGKSKEKQAKAWLRWWKKQQESKAKERNKGKGAI
jgi:hypothetical protein